MSKIKKLLYIFFALPMSFFLVQPSFALTTSPLRFDITLSPGSSKQIEILVENSDAREYVYKLYASSLTTDETGKVLFEKGKDPAEQWISFEKNSITLKNGQKRTVKLNIIVPTGEAPGSHSLALMVKRETSKNEALGISPQNAIPLFITVSGLVQEKMEILSWLTANKIFFGKDFSFLLKFQNSGNVNLETKGALRIKDLFGRQLFEEPIRLGTTLFSNSSRSITIKTSPRLLPGVYKAELLIKYGPLENMVKGSTVFWYVPLWLIAFATMLFVAAIYWVIKIKNKSYVEEQ